MKFGTDSYRLLLYSRGRSDVPPDRPFQKPRCPPAGLSFGARHDAARAAPPRTESRQAPLSGSPQRPTSGQRAARLFPPPLSVVEPNKTVARLSAEARREIEELRRRKLVNRHTVPHYGYAAEYRRRHDAISRPDQSERQSPLAPGVALIIIVLSSLGFWCVIWLAVSSSAWALPQ